MDEYEFIRVQQSVAREMLVFLRHFYERDKQFFMADFMLWAARKYDLDEHFINQMRRLTPETVSN